MEGVSIYTNNHKVFSTQFDNPLRAALAIDTALSTTNSVSWVPSLHPEYHPNGEDSDSEEEDDDERDGWAAKVVKDRAAGGLAVVQVIRKGLRYIAPIAADVDPVVPLAFLAKLHDVLESYIDGAVTESSLKDHFDLVLPLLEEMLASGRPLLTSTSQLKELVLPPPKVFAKVANAAGLGASASPGFGPTGPAGASNATALVSSPLPWRRAGIKHSANEIYFDVNETLSVILSPTSTILSGSLTGAIECRSRLSGMPDLVLSFADPSLMNDIAVHACVRTARWKKDKVVSFVPPDGAFTLLTYLVPFPTSLHLPSSSSSNKPSLSSQSHLLPFTLKPLITQGALGGTFSLALSSRSLAPLSNIKIRLPLGRGVTGVTGAVSGGGFPVANGKGGGAGRWDTVVDEEGRVAVEWDLEELRTGDRVAVLQGQFNSLPGSRTSPALSVSFSCADGGFSGIRIAGLKVAGGSEQYTIYKGVRVRGRGDAEVRCF